MSESKVPLPEPQVKAYRYEQSGTGLGGWYTAVMVDGYTAGQMRSYGDARAAEARRLTLLEVADWLADNDRLTEWRTLEPLINTLRALANKASPT